MAPLASIASDGQASAASGPWWTWEEARRALLRWSGDYIGGRIDRYKPAFSVGRSAVNFSQRVLYVDPTLGSRLCADAKVMPQTWGTRTITRQGQLKVLVARAVTAHECGHILWSAWPLEMQGPLHMRLWNALEDERVERLMALVSRRAQRDLRQLGLRTWMEGWRLTGNRTLDLRNAVLFARYNEHIVPEDRTKITFAERDDTDLFHREVLPLARAAWEAGSAHDVVKIAQRILTIWGVVAQDNETAPPNPTQVDGLPQGIRPDAPDEPEKGSNETHAKEQDAGEAREGVPSDEPGGPVRPGGRGGEDVPKPAQGTEGEEGDTDGSGDGGDEEEVTGRGDNDHTAGEEAGKDVSEGDASGSGGGEGNESGNHARGGSLEPEKGTGEGDEDLTPGSITITINGLGEGEQEPTLGDDSDILDSFIGQIKAPEVSDGNASLLLRQPYKDLEAEVRPVATLLVRELTVRTPEVADDWNARRGRLDMQAVVRSRGRTPLREPELEADAPDGLAIAVLVDDSGSMGCQPGRSIEPLTEGGLPSMPESFNNKGFPAFHVRRALMIFNRACADLSIPLALGQAGDCRHHMHRPGPTLYMKEPVIWMQGFTDNPHNEATRSLIAGFYGNGSQNAMTRCLNQAAKELSGVDAAKKVILFVHDGQVVDEEPWQVLESITNHRKHGLVVIGVFVGPGSGSDKMEAIFGKDWFIVVKDSTELPMRMGRILRRLRR